MVIAGAVAGIGLGLLVHAATASDVPRPDPPPRSFLIAASSAYRPAECPGARSGLAFWRAAYGHWRAAQRLEGPPRYVRYPCDATARRAAEWKTRAAAAWRSLRKWKREQYDWRSWLPRNWYLVGSCETGYGKDPNWHHSNSQYVSAFGISRSIYDSDAAYAGQPPWDDARPPTPWQQFQTALGHYRKYGDGWGCPGP